MSADEFVAWSLAQPKDDEGGRFELVDGRVIRLQSERIVHGEVKLAVAAALREAAARAGAPCFTLGDGATVRISPRRVNMPDALVYCGERHHERTVEIANPVIIVEVVSADSVERDYSDKVEDYVSLATVQHYLIVDPRRRAVVHHRRRGEEGFLIHIRKSGRLRLEPPGLEIDVASLFERD